MINRTNTLGTADCWPCRKVFRVSVAHWVDDLGNPSMDDSEIIR